MEITVYLAQIWGPIILAVGIGIFTSRNYYVRVYRELEKDALAVLVFGMVGMALGIMHVHLHNVWSSFPQFVVSLLGWALLVKAVVFIIAPKLVDRAGDRAANSKLIPVIGIVMLILGVYLSWVGYVS